MGGVCPRCEGWLLTWMGMAWVDADGDLWGLTRPDTVVCWRVILVLVLVASNYENFIWEISSNISKSVLLSQVGSWFDSRLARFHLLLGWVSWVAMSKVGSATDDSGGAVVYFMMGSTNTIQHTDSGHQLFREMRAGKKRVCFARCRYHPRSKFDKWPSPENTCVTVLSQNA